MKINRWNRVGGALVMGLLAGACDTATMPEPDADLDTNAAIADYEAVQDVMEAAGWESFQALGGRTPFGTSAAALDAVALLRVPSSGEDARGFAQDLAGKLTDATRAAAAPIISDHNRGKTFVYDPELDRYAHDPDRTGAPETGVRLILYAVDEAGKPIVEEETGYADLIDEGDTSTEVIALHLVVVAGDEVVLDYRTGVDFAPGQGAVTVVGFLRHNGAQLDFDIAASASNVDGQTSLDIDFEMRVDARDFSVIGSVSGIEEGQEGQGHVELVVRHGSHSIAVDVQGGGGEIEGTFHLNGALFATVSGDAENPTFLGASGEPLTAAEGLVLHLILDVVVEGVFDLLEDLVDPVDELVIIGIIL